MTTAHRDAALEARLKERLRGCCFGGTIHAFSTCDSTMERAHALAGAGAGEGTLVFAARQTEGRGRLGRTWESPDGGAYFSLILKPARPVAETPQLSLVAGLAAAEALKELTGLSPAIRWPNDLLLDGRKIAGILTEVSSVRDPRFTNHERRSYMVLGVGINVTTDPNDLPDTATSLAACGAACDPYRLVATLCSKLDGWYDIWTAQGFAPIRAALRPWLSHVGDIVRVRVGSDHIEGTAQDVDERGRLLIRLDSGLMRAMEMGEVGLLR